MPNTDEIGAAHVAEMVQQQVKALQLPHSRSTVGRHVTVSIGTTTAIPEREDTQLSFLHDADIALYRAKANGRNQTVHFSAASSNWWPALTDSGAWLWSALTPSQVQCRVVDDPGR